MDKNRKEASATRADVRLLDTKLDASVAKLDASMASLNEKLDSSVAKLDAGMASLNEKLDASVANLNEKLDATAARLDAKIDRVAVDQSRLRGEFHDMEKRLTARMDSGFGRIAGRMDAFLDDLQTYKRESVTLPKTLDEHGARLRDHERRISALEARGISPISG